MTRFLPLLLCASLHAAAAIDREAVVSRHNITVTTSSDLQLGNGEFAMTADITGLISFSKGSMLSHWGWHSNPLPPGQTVSGFQWTPHPSYSGRQIPYPLDDGSAISSWMSRNPHAMNLGKLGLALTKADGSLAALSDLQNPTQTLDLWNGLLTSRFTFDGQPVLVETCVHPALDAVAARITSPLIAAGRIKIRLSFPYPTDNGLGDDNNPNGHTTTMSTRNGRQVDFARKADADTYGASLAWSADGTVTSPSRHEYLLSPAAAERFEFICAFAPQPLQAPLPTAQSTIEACANHWPAFWKTGGAIDLSASKDPRWKELERRIVLSQYLMAAVEAGSNPPSESGLMGGDPWHGRFHFEMTWWHGMHYALWDRWPLLNRWLGIYDRYLPGARATAQKQGYKGARWFKCTGNTPVEWPGTWHAWLTWMHPHPIFFAEMDYRAHPTAQTLEKWRDVVLATADFMATFPEKDKAGANRLVLGGPIMVVGENNDVDATVNPSFDVGYWRYGLRVAQQWRLQLGLPRDTLYDRVLERLSPIPVQDSVYVLWEGVQDMWTKLNYEHPSLIGTYGMLPGDGVDTRTMRRTFNKVLGTWQMGRLWGWDFAMLAMSAARLKQPGKAVDLLLHDDFRVPANGVNNGNYFPGNGGLLYAVAMMAAGWDFGPKTDAPGFPNDGSWTVRWEGLKQAPGLEDSASNLAIGTLASRSSSVEVVGWSIAKINNGITDPGDPGWSSSGYQDNGNHAEWIRFDLGTAYNLKKAVLVPRRDAGNEGKSFPVDFTIDVSMDGTTWTSVVSETGYANPGSNARSFGFVPILARYLRVNATELGPNTGGWFQFQLNEIEIYGDAPMTASRTPRPLPAGPSLHATVRHGEVFLDYGLGAGERLKGIEVYGLSGTRIWSYAAGTPGAGGGSGSVRWNRLTSSKAKANPGTYLVRLSTSRRDHYAKLALP